MTVLSAEMAAVVAMGVFTFALATILIVANRRLYVFEDPRIDTVEEMLPHANCGACGYPGCRPFAESLVNGGAQPANCTVSSPDGHKAIADVLGVDVGSQIKLVARLACAGGDNVAKMRAQYKGYSSCISAAEVSGGGKACSWGCLGLEDCERVCTFDAIHMNEHGIPVVDNDKCTACGDCVEVCPKMLFSLQPTTRSLWVPCKNKEHGDSVLAACAVACTACERCVKDAPPGLMSMHNNLPVIDYSRNHRTRVPIERCPTGAIVWIDEKSITHKGSAASKVLRHEPLPCAPS